MHTKSYKYPLLNDPDWLRQKYETEGLSTVGIAELAGAKTANSARQALLRYGIPVRSIGEGLTHNREDDGFIINQEVIDGCLLGDGFLRVWDKNSPTARPHFAKRNKYYDHVLFVAKELFPTRSQEAVRELHEYHDDKPYPLFALRSLVSDRLIPFYERWYPKYNQQVKVVPKDIELTPKVMLHWFLDDGYSFRRRKESDVKQVIVAFCSESFSKDDQDLLREKMLYNFGIKSWLHKIKAGTGYRIEIPQSQSPSFFELIGKPPVPSLAYKWK